MFALASVLGILTATPAGGATDAPTPDLDAIVTADLPAATDAVETAELTLTTEPLVLAGHRGEAVFTVELAERGTIALVLPLRWSRVVDRARSSITVAIDDVPLATAWLADLGDDRAVLRLTTDALPAGFHRVALRPHLRIGEDECRALDPGEAWLSIERGATARVAASVPGLAAHVARLRGADRTELTIALGGDGAAIADPAAILAYLDADAVARTWRLAPRRRAAGTPAQLAVAWDAAALPVPEAVARIDAGPDGLRVDATSIDGARAALASLADERFVTACTALPCFVGGAPAPAPTALSPTSAPGDGALVTDLGHLGHARGFTADGEGIHTLRVAWQRRANRFARRWPELHLLVTVPAAGPLDHAASAVRITVNGRPIASYDLRGAADGVLHLVARVPEALWQEPAWVFEIAVALRGGTTRTCARDSDTGLWAVIEPASHLSIVAVDEERGGLAELGTLAGDTRPPLVAHALTWDQAAALAAVAWPFVALAPHDPWRWTERCDAALCIAPADATPGSRASLAAAAALPLTGTDAVRLARAACTPGDCTRLDVTLPRGAAVPAAPDYGALLGTRAIAHGDRWYVAGDLGAVRTRRSVHGGLRRDGWPRAAASHEARRLVRRDLVWAAIAIACLGGLFVWFRKR